MTTVYFVRHAQPNKNNHDDATRELTEKGLLDCALVTEYFQNIPVDAVLSSPYKRSFDTVKGVAEEKALPITTVYDFRERKVDSKWIDGFNGYAKETWADFTYKLPGGECLQEVQERNIAALWQVLKEHEGQTVVVGSHGTALSCIINYFDPSFLYEDFQRIRGLMPWIVRFDFEEKACAAITEYDLFTGEAKRREIR